MDKYVRLVFAPGDPVTLGSLCPKSHLLLLQSRLAAEAIHSTIMDLGALDEMGTDITNESSGNISLQNGWSFQAESGWGGFPVLHKIVPSRNTRSTNNAIERKLCRICEDQPSLILFWIETRDMYRAFKEYIRHIPASFNNIKLVLAGPYMMHYGAYALNDCSRLDAVITGDLADSVVGLLHQDASESKWREIPGILYRNADGAVCRCEYRPIPSIASPLAIGNFHSQEPETQFPLFHLTFDWHHAAFYYHDSYRRPDNRKFPETIVEEMNYLQRHANARTFHIAAPHIPADTLADFADMLLKQNLVAIYSLGDITENIGAALSERLFASGCRSIGFRIPTGSQRMLEDFYGCTSSISAMRASLRYCREAGLYTVIRLCYPCPSDDYHTRAEIELFVEAVKPDSVCIESPSLAPDSLWFRRASEFGFFISHRAYQRYAVGADSPYGAFPFTMRGWNSKRIFQAQASLAAAVEKLGCRVNISEQEGLLARLARSVMDESTFLDELVEAFTPPDTVRLHKLADCLNTNARTLSSGFTKDSLVGKAVSFS